MFGNGKYVESTHWVAPVCSAFDWGNTFGVSGSPERAAGSRRRPADQWCGGDASNEADTAQPPSLRAPEGLLLCMPSCFSSACFWFDGAWNALLHHLFSYCIWGVNANTDFVIALVGHSIQTKYLLPFQIPSLSVCWMPLCFFFFSGAAQLRWRGGQRTPVPPDCGWPASGNRTMIWRGHSTPNPVLPLLLLPIFFSFSFKKKKKIYEVTASLPGSFQQCLRARKGQTERDQTF